MKQTRALRDADAELKAKGVRVIGVSTDPISEQLAFAQKYQLTMDLLSDEDAAICRAFRVPMNENNRASRESFIFRNGKMIWHDPKVYPSRQAQDVFRVIEEVEAGEAAATAAAGS